MRTDSASLRLFFAIVLPNDVKAHLARLRPEADNRDYRWVEPALLHITLAFLGQQPSTRLAELQEISNSVASTARSGTLRLGDPGAFGSKRAPRVLWVGLDGDVDALHLLHDNLSQALRNRSFDMEVGVFRPHITLARRRQSATGGPPPGWPPVTHPQTTFPVDHLMLFESRLSPRGSTYVPLIQTPLSSS